MQALADLATIPPVSLGRSAPPSASGDARTTPTQQAALARLAQLTLYPEQKHEEFDAVHTPLVWTPLVDTDGLKFRVQEDHAQDISRILTSQRYVYRSKLKWYILHPEQIEAPQLHKARWWWRASVFHVDGVRFVGNGNHCGIQAKGASHRRGVEHFFAIASIRSCAKRVGRRGLRVTKNRRGTGALSALGRNEGRSWATFSI